MIHIASRPHKQRHKGRLLLIAREGFRHLFVEHLPCLLRRDDLVVVNDTRTLPARLEGVRIREHKGRKTKARIEGLFLQQKGFNITMMLRPAKKVRVDDYVAFAQDNVRGQILEQQDRGIFLIKIHSDISLLKSILNVYGSMPIPPYIGRRADEQDLRDYQTSYACHDGSVATPTAGLHFSPAVRARVARRIHKPLCCVTLHVGLGTFLPVENIDTHVMDKERCCLSAETALRINRARRRGGRIVAIGTTVLRTLESSALNDGTVVPFSGWTNLFVKPGYRFRVVDVLVTNFHAPNSTLLYLLKAFCGTRTVARAYHLAQGRGYRFYSYGDACFVERCRAN